MNRLAECESILQANGQVCSSAQLVKKWNKKDIEALGQILKEDLNAFPIPPAECYYPRDALLFKKNGKIVAYLEICFECFRIKANLKLDLCLSAKTFRALAQFLETLGHTPFFGASKSLQNGG